jgi:mRNA-degrading endonuclease RelE of RelBE toxin-antitoxin system
MHKREQSQQLKQRLAIMADLFRSPFTSSFLFFPFLQKDLGAWSPWGKFLRDRQQLDELLYAEIAERRRNNDADRIGILSLLRSAHDEARNPMTDQDYKQLKGYSGVYRVDQGEYRIIYKILEDAIEVFRVGKRNNDEVYENL